VRLLRKRCRILPAGGLGVSPSFKKSPKIGGYRGLIESIPAVSNIKKGLGKIPKPLLSSLVLMTASPKLCLYFIATSLKLGENSTSL
jgi:hypothetical protein